MKEKCQVSTYWLPKMAYCLVFFAFWIAKCDAQLGLPPLINVPPGDATVQNGGTATFSTTIGVSLTPLTITWRLNGTIIQRANVVNTTVPLLGTTVSTLTITNASALDAGYYSATVQNSGGSVSTGNALLTVLPPPISNAVTVLTVVSPGTGMFADGFHVQLSGPSGSNYVIEASTDLMSWTPLATNSAPSGTVSYTDTEAIKLPLRYYRARLQ
jgi:hypothetical protein